MNGAVIGSSSFSPHHQQIHPSASWPGAVYTTYLPQPYHDPAFASLAYRPLHLPLQQHQQPQRHYHPFQLVYRHHASVPRYLPFNPQHALVMANPTDEELAELQKLSNDYEPEVTGPLVGPLQPSTAIASQYASADPILQAKTAALPQKYSHYRSVRGDGRCGWRAIAFGYFETLIHHGDANRFLEEETRLRSSSNILNMAGFDPMLYEDFADETFELLRKISQALPAGNADEVLLEAFNDEALQNYIMTHFKTLTAAWMKTRPEDYAPYLPGQNVDEYCNASVMPIGAEIDNVGLSALTDAFLSPAGITLEVLYLDRSEGTEVNMHRFAHINHGGFDVGTVRLLYRPGHYDLLYKHQDVPASAIPPPATVPTYLQYSTASEPAADLGIADYLVGMPYVNPPESWTSYSSYSDVEYPPPSASIQHCTPALPPASVPPTQLHMQCHSDYPQTPAHLVPPPLQLPQDLPLRTVSRPMLSPTAGFQDQLGGPFRPSAWELKPEFVQATSQTPLQTAIFRKNENFQPEEWRPDDEYLINTGRAPRHRNSE